MYFFSKYSIGALQLISASFMLYAIFRIWCILRTENTLREFFSQKVIVLHFSAFTVYLLSILIYYIFWALWDTTSSDDTNKVFLTWGLSVQMSAVSQFILIYIYWKLSSDIEG